MELQILQPQPEFLKAISHTKAVVMNVMDNSSNIRTVSVLYDDGWCFSEFPPEEMNRALTLLAIRDRTVVGFQASQYKLENGIYKKAIEFYPEKL